MMPPMSASGFSAINFSSPVFRLMVFSAPVSRPRLSMKYSTSPVLSKPAMLVVQRIFHADFEKIFPAAFAIGLEDRFAAVVGHLGAEADFVIFVDDEAGEIGILLESAFSRRC